MKGVIMRNLCGTIFYIKTNVLQDFRICMSVPLRQNLHHELFGSLMNIYLKIESLRQINRNIKRII